jgi:serine/threonine-protein kinase
MRVGGVVAAAAGLVGIGVGSAFGVTAISKKNQSSNDCGAAIGRADPDACTAAGAQLRRDGLSAATVATGAFVAGAIAFAGGVTLFAVGGNKTAPVQVGASPWSVVVSGRW